MDHQCILNVLISCGICWTLLHRGLSPYSLAWWSQLSGKLAHLESPKSRSSFPRSCRKVGLVPRWRETHFARKLDLHTHWIFWKSAWCSPNYATCGHGAGAVIFSVCPKTLAIPEACVVVVFAVIGWRYYANKPRLNCRSNMASMSMACVTCESHQENQTNATFSWASWPSHGAGLGPKLVVIVSLWHIVTYSDMWCHTVEWFVECLGMSQYV